jgi:hypothetical protein
VKVIFGLNKEGYLLYELVLDAEKPTPPVRRTPLPDSEQPDAVKRRKLVQERPRPRPSDRCPICEANVNSLTVIVDRLADAEREIKRLRFLLQHTEYKYQVLPPAGGSIMQEETPL